MPRTAKTLREIDILSPEEVRTLIHHGRQVLTNDVRESWATADFTKFELGAEGDLRRLDWSARLEPDLGTLWLDAWNSADDLALMWGPRGTRAPGLHLVDLETGAVRQLFDLPVIYSSCVFLPDGKRVLFKRANEVLLVDSETLELKVVLEVERDSAGARAKGMSLSRDGRKLAILARRDEGDIWVVDLETRESDP